MALTGRLDVLANLKETVSADLAPAIREIIDRIGWKIESGTTTGKADKIWADTRSVGASETLDLTALTGGPFGSVTLAKLKGIIVASDEANTGILTLSAPASPPGVAGIFSALDDGIKIGPGDVFAWTYRTTGVTVTNSTADMLEIANSVPSPEASYSIILIGTSV